MMQVSFDEGCSMQPMREMDGASRGAANLLHPQKGAGPEGHGAKEAQQDRQRSTGVEDPLCAWGLEAR